MKTPQEQAIDHVENKLLFSLNSPEGWAAESGWLSGYLAGMERSAEISTEFALERGPTHNFNMGGHAIAKRIRDEKESVK